MPVVMSSLSTFTVCMHSRLLSFLYISLPIEHALPGRNDYASSIYARNYGEITRAHVHAAPTYFSATHNANSRARGVRVA